MRIILADHNDQSRRAVGLLLEQEPEFVLVGDVVDARELLQMAEKHPADLILIDRELPGLQISVMIARLKAFEPQPIIVVMSSEFEYSRMLLKAGADAFMSKSDQPEWLLDTLDKYTKQLKMKEDANRPEEP